MIIALDSCTANPVGFISAEGILDSVGALALERLVISVGIFDMAGHIIPVLFSVFQYKERFGAQENLKEGAVLQENSHFLRVPCAPQYPAVFKFQSRSYSKFQSCTNHGHIPVAVQSLSYPVAVKFIFQSQSRFHIPVAVKFRRFHIPVTVKF